MNRHTLLGALLLSGSLMFISAPLPSFAQPKPDAYVYVGPIVKETSLTKGTVEKIVVTVGNQNSFIPPPDLHFTAFMGVSSGGQAVCQSYGSYSTLAPNTPVPAFQFALTYPSPITQALPKQGVAAQDTQPAGSVRTDAARIAQSAQYTLIARITPTKPCEQVETNCANNSVTRTLQFPAGGTPSCVKLQ
jgi:hypothetical protein